MRTYKIYNADSGNVVAEGLRNLTEVKYELSGFEGCYEAIRSDNQYTLFENGVQQYNLTEYKS